MTYTMPNGFTIETISVDTGTEFITSNQAGDIVGTSRLSGLSADVMISAIKASAT